MKNKNDEIVCRCEGVTLGEIRKCIADGCQTIDEIKHITRAGMGPCQGRTCRMLIAKEISNAYGIPLEDVLMPAFRVPVVPISIKAMSDACREDRIPE